MRSPFRVGYVFAAPAVTLLALYLFVFLALNSRQGSGALADWVSDALQGSLEYAALQVGPDLLTVAVYDAKVYDLRGRAILEVREVGCRFRPSGLVRGRLWFDRCHGADARLLIEEYDDGQIGFLAAFEGAFRPKNTGSRPVVVDFDDIELQRIDVLVQMREMTMRFDDVRIRGGGLEARPGRVEIDADAVAESGGRLQFTDALLTGAEQRSGWSEVEWNIARRARPWVASYAENPTPRGGARGLLDVNYERLVIDSLKWRGEVFQFDRLLLEGDALGFDAAGAIQLMPEVPKLPDDERGVAYYEGRVAFEVPPDSHVWDFVIPGLIAPVDGAESVIDPFAFEGYGSVRFFEGGTRLRARDVAVAGWPLRSLDLGMRWEKDRFTLTPDSRIEAWGGALTGGGTMDVRDGRWQLNLCADGLALGPLLAPLSDEPLLPDDILAATMSTTPSTCAADGLAAPGLALEGDLSRKGLSLAPALSTPLDKELPDPLIALDLPSLTLSWDRPPAALPHRRVRVSLGALLDLRGNLQLRGSERDGLTVRAGEDRLTMRGDVGLVDGRFDGLRVRAQTPQFEEWLRVFVDAELPEGVALVTAFELDGPFETPTVSGFEVAFEKADDDRRFPAFSLSGELELRGDRLVIEDGSLASGLGNGRVRGTLDLFDGSVLVPRAEPAFDLTVAVDAVDVGQLLPGAAVDARLDATFRAQGGPEGLVVAGSRLEAIDFRAYGEPVDFLTVGGFELSDERINLTDVFLVKGKGELRGDVAIDLAAETLAVQLRGERFRLEEFRQLTALGADLEGRFDIFASVEGTFDAPDVGGSLLSEDLRLVDVDVGGAALTFDTYEGAVEVAGALGGDLDLVATLPLDGSPWSVSAAFHRVALGERLVWLRSAIDHSALTGRLDARLDPFGDGAASVSLGLSDLELGIDGRAFDIAQPATVTFDLLPAGSEQARAAIAAIPGASPPAEVASDAEPAALVVAELDELAVGTEGRYLRASGRATLGHPGGDGIALTVTGQTDASLLRFVPSLIVDAEGPVDVAVNLEGPLNAPELSGVLEIGALIIAPRGLGTSVTFDPGTLRVEPGAIVIAEDAPLTGGLFGGDFSAYGEIGLDGFLPAALDVQTFVTNLTYRVPDELTTTLTLDTRFRAADLQDFDTWTLIGDVEIVDARWFGDVQVVGDSLSFGGFGRTVDRFSLPVWREVEAVGRLRTDLGITGRDRLDVVNAIGDAQMNLEFRTDLRLTGRLEEMVMVGEMTALERGTVTYRGERFDVRETTLYFEGARDENGFPMPRIDAELEANIRPCVVRDDTLDTAVNGTPDRRDLGDDILLTARVEGQLPTQLTFELDSTPFYDQRDLLSLILTGCSVDQLSGQTAGAQTLEAVLRPLLDAVERNVEERLDLEEFDVVPSSEGTAGITIEDEVSERFTWTFDALLGSATESRQVVRGAYRLFDWLSLELQEQSSNRDTIQLDTGVRFRLEFD